MENFIKCNTNQICSAKSFLKSKSHDYEYKQEIKFLSFIIQKKGFYLTYNIDSSVVPNESILEDKNLYIENNTVYKKPFIRLTMSNDNKHDLFFETQEDLFKFMETPEMKNISWTSIK